MIEQNVRASIRGEVTEFLISRELLLTKVLNKTDMQESVYKSDPGLFYSTSTSFLTHISEENKTLYFLIVTPKSTLTDVSSVYTTHNFGCIDANALNKIEVPTEFYFISSDKQYHPVSINRPDCLLRYSYLSCPKQSPHRRSSMYFSFVGK